MVNAHHT